MKLIKVIAYLLLLAMAFDSGCRWRAYEYRRTCQEIAGDFSSGICTISVESKRE